MLSLEATDVGFFTTYHSTAVVSLIKEAANFVTPENHIAVSHFCILKVG
jgi:hypothetical protein